MSYATALLTDVEALSEVKPRRLGSKKVILSLPESKTFFHVFYLPAGLKRKNLSVIAESEALKTIPLEPEEVYSATEIISETNDYIEVLYVSALKEIVEDYLDVAKSAGLKPIVLDIESASLARAFAFEIEKTKKGFVVIADIGAESTIFTVIDGGNSGNAPR